MTQDKKSCMISNHSTYTEGFHITLEWVNIKTDVRNFTFRKFSKLDVTGRRLVSWWHESVTGVRDLTKEEMMSYTPGSLLLSHSVLGRSMDAHGKVLWARCKTLSRST